MAGPGDVYREFTVRRHHWFKYEPVMICLNNSGDPQVYPTHLFFTRKLQAMRVASVMRTQYNDGLFLGREYASHADRDTDDTGTSETAGTD